MELRCSRDVRVLYTKFASGENRGDSQLRKGRAGVLFVIPAAIILFMALTTQSQNRSSAKKAAAGEKEAGAVKERHLTPRAAEWVDATLRKMSV